MFPAFLFVLHTCHALGWFTLFVDEFKQLGKHLLGGASFISNFMLWNESGYFDASAEVKPLLHLWTLGIEEHFYILWPITLWASWKVRLDVLTLTISFLVMYFLLNIASINQHPSSTFYMPHTRAWGLLIGSVLAHISGHKTANLSPVLNSKKLRLYALSNNAFIQNIQSLAGTLLLALGLIFITEKCFLFISGAYFSKTNCGERE